MLQGTLENQFNKVQSDIDKIWEKEKLSLVPGAHLLDRLFKDYGLRFKKTRDGVKLANLMAAKNIEKEIQEFLSDLVK